MGSRWGQPSSRADCRDITKLIRRLKRRQRAKDLIAAQLLEMKAPEDK